MIKWDESRCKELEAFEQLLREVSSINNASHCLERIARCIEFGASLDKFSMQRPNFRTFIRQLAIDDMAAKREQT